GLIYNGNHFDGAGLPGPPETLADLDSYAHRLSKVEPDGTITHMGSYPDDFSRVSWGWVFGGEHYDPVAERYTLDDPGIVASIEWANSSYHDRYGYQEIQNFRSQLGAAAGGRGPLGSGLFSIISIGQYRIETLRNVRPETDWRFAPLPH